jgi:hypothetical protein
MAPLMITHDIHIIVLLLPSSSSSKGNELEAETYGTVHGLGSDLRVIAEHIASLPKANA